MVRCQKEVYKQVCCCLCSSVAVGSALVFFLLFSNHFGDRLGPATFPLEAGMTRQLLLPAEWDIFSATIHSSFANNRSDNNHPNDTGLEVYFSSPCPPLSGPVITLEQVYTIQLFADGQGRSANDFHYEYWYLNQGSVLNLNVHQDVGATSSSTTTTSIFLLQGETILEALLKNEINDFFPSPFLETPMYIVHRNNDSFHAEHVVSTSDVYILMLYTSSWNILPGVNNNKIGNNHSKDDNDRLVDIELQVHTHWNATTHLLQASDNNIQRICSPSDAASKEGCVIRNWGSWPDGHSFASACYVVKNTFGTNDDNVDDLSMVYVQSSVQKKVDGIIELSLTLCILGMLFGLFLYYCCCCFCCCCCTSDYWILEQGRMKSFTYYNRPIPVAYVDDAAVPSSGDNHDVTVSEVTTLLSASSSSSSSSCPSKYSFHSAISQD